MGAGTWQVYRRFEALPDSPRSGLRDSRPGARVRDDGLVVEMTREDFEAAVSEGLDLVPADLAAQMDNVVVLVEDDAPADAPDPLGLYEGVPLTERDHMWAAGALPDRITIFRNPTLAFCESRDDVVEEVAVTVVHEIAHHFGIDDERLHELGWA